MFSLHRALELSQEVIGYPDHLEGEGRITLRSDVHLKFAWHQVDDHLTHKWDNDYLLRRDF